MDVCAWATIDTPTCVLSYFNNPDPAGPPAEVAPAVAALLALQAREQVVVAVPRPHTSPDGVAQVTGKRTWFWMDEAEWQPASVRAELPGVWAEVTATPVRTVWRPGDGGEAVSCPGPGRPHPGTRDATTDCGHVYTTKGAYTLRVAVTYEVRWHSSTGASGVQEPFVLTTALPVTVEERQVVVR